MPPTPALPPSLWAATAEPAPATPPLSGEARADVAVIGGGFTGLSAALHLAELGKDVLLLEAGEPGWGASGRNGGQVIPGTKYPPDDLANLLGGEIGTRAAAFAETTADILFSIVERHRIACHARRSGWIKAAHSEATLKRLGLAAAQRQRMGASIELLDRRRIAELLGATSYSYVGGLLDHRGGSLQPLSYARGLARAAIAQGARIHGGSNAQSIIQDGKGWRVVTPVGVVRADRILIATNAYTDGLWPRLRRTVIPMSSVQIATPPLDESLRQEILPQGHVMSDTRRLLLYFRLDPAGRLVFGGRGGVLEMGMQQAYAAVKRTMRRMFPMLATVPIEYAWSGHVAITPDAIPHVWQLAPNAFAALGYNGHGVAMATSLGQRLAHFIATQREEELPLPIQPLRPIPLHALRWPAVAAAVQYHRLMDALGK
ncbi:MAG TPA: FAD-binding oxidoreductase [Alphaproteobacteria bacterium]|nr:FAD-binding oxidoreductase [Alphaproteobacteria bacterium]